MAIRDQATVERYPMLLRLLHWVRALLLFGLIAAGFTMTHLMSDAAFKLFDPYPWHKSFGLLIFLLVLVQLAIRASSRLPEPPESLPRHEAFLSKAAHAGMYALLVVVPLMGYAMSSTFTQSDGVTFFGIPVPELLAKNDRWFAMFQWLHRWLAYALLALIVLHIAGALKHRFFDRDRRNDVLPRML